MLDFLITLIIYIIIAFALFIVAVVLSKNDCKKLNAELSHDCYRVNYKGCFKKAFFFPLTIANMLYELIRKE